MRFHAFGHGPLTGAVSFSPLTAQRALGSFPVMNIDTREHHHAHHRRSRTGRVEVGVRA